MKKLCFLLFGLLCFSFSFAQKLSTDQQAAKKVVLDFFKWYKVNPDKINSFQLYKGKKAKGQPPYVIDWAGVEKYFDYIRKNVPYLGETFIMNEREHFKKIQVEFNKYPEDEIPPGFDYDRFTGGQEAPEYMIDELLLGKNTKIEVVIKGMKGNVNFVSWYTVAENKKEKQVQTIEVVKEKDAWKISKNIETK